MNQDEYESSDVCWRCPFIFDTALLGGMAGGSSSYRSRELEQLRQELRRELRMFDDVRPRGPSPPHPRCVFPENLSRAISHAFIYTSSHSFSRFHDVRMYIFSPRHDDARRSKDTSIDSSYRPIDRSSERRNERHVERGRRAAANPSTQDVVPPSPTRKNRAASLQHASRSISGRTTSGASRGGGVPHHEGGGSISRRPASARGASPSPYGSLSRAGDQRHSGNAHGRAKRPASARGAGGSMWSRDAAAGGHPTALGFGRSSAASERRRDRDRRSDRGWDPYDDGVDDDGGDVFFRLLRSERSDGDWSVARPSRESSRSGRLGSARAASGTPAPTARRRPASARAAPSSSARGGAIAGDDAAMRSARGRGSSYDRDVSYGVGERGRGTERSIDVGRRAARSSSASARPAWGGGGGGRGNPSREGRISENGYGGRLSRESSRDGGGGVRSTRATPKSTRRAPRYDYDGRRVASPARAPAVAEYDYNGRRIARSQSNATSVAGVRGLRSARAPGTATKARSVRRGSLTDRDGVAGSWSAASTPTGGGRRRRRGDLLGFGGEGGFEPEALSFGGGRFEAFEREVYGGGDPGDNLIGLDDLIGSASGDLWRRTQLGALGGARWGVERDEARRPSSARAVERSASKTTKTTKTAKKTTTAATTAAKRPASARPASARPASARPAFDAGPGGLGMNWNDRGADASDRHRRPATSRARAVPASAYAAPVKPSSAGRPRTATARATSTATAAAARKHTQTAAIANRTRAEKLTSRGEPESARVVRRAYPTAEELAREVRAASAAAAARAGSEHGPTDRPRARTRTPSHPGGLTRRKSFGDDDKPSLSRPAGPSGLSRGVYASDGVYDPPDVSGGFVRRRPTSARAGYGPTPELNPGWMDGPASAAGLGRSRPQSARSDRSRPQSASAWTDRFGEASGGHHPVDRFHGDVAGGTDAGFGFSAGYRSRPSSVPASPVEKRVARESAAGSFGAPLARGGGGPGWAAGGLHGEGSNVSVGSQPGGGPVFSTSPAVGHRASHGVDGSGPLRVVHQQQVGHQQQGGVGVVGGYNYGGYGGGVRGSSSTGDAVNMYLSGGSVSGARASSGGVSQEATYKKWRPGSGGVIGATTSFGDAVARAAAMASAPSPAQLAASYAAGVSAEHSSSSFQGGGGGGGGAAASFQRWSGMC